jgi:hypothetical protein
MMQKKRADASGALLKLANFIFVKATFGSARNMVSDAFGL